MTEQAVGRRQVEGLDWRRRVAEEVAAEAEERRVAAEEVMEATDGAGWAA